MKFNSNRKRFIGRRIEQIISNGDLSNATVNNSRRKEGPVLMKAKKKPCGEQLITTDATENLLMADLLPTRKKIKNEKNKKEEEPLGSIL